MEVRILQLISALRASGVRVSLAESIEAFSAADLVGVQDREHFRVSLRATIIKDVHDLPVFDRLFPFFFGTGPLQVFGGNAVDQLSPAEVRMLAEVLRHFTALLRDRMERVLSGKPLSARELRTLGQMMPFGQAEDVQNRRGLPQRVLGALGFNEVRRALGEMLEILEQIGMGREDVERLQEVIRQNLEAMDDQIRYSWGPRLEQQIGRQPPDSIRDGLINRPFEALSGTDKEELRREAVRLATVLRTRVALRQKRAKGGQLDPKATIRANLRYQGLPMELKHRDRVRKPSLVVLCDISTSMRFCAELMLSFLFVLHGQIRKTRAFAFIDHLESIWDDFDGSHADAAVASVLARMPSGHYNTDLGGSLHDFNDKYLDTLDGQTTLILVGDGRNNYNDPRLDLFRSMSLRAARTLWLNPEAPAFWHGDSDMPKYAPLCDAVLKVGSLREFASAVDQLLCG